MSIKSFKEENLPLDEWSVDLNIGDADPVRENYVHFCTFARENPPGCPIYIERAKMDDMDVLAVIYPAGSQPAITRWFNQMGSFKTSFGFNHSHYSGTRRLEEYCRRNLSVKKCTFIPR